MAQYGYHIDFILKFKFGVFIAASCQLSEAIFRCSGFFYNSKKLNCFVHMRQFHFDLLLFWFFGSDFFLNGFSNPFIVRFRPSYLFEANFHFSVEVFLFTCGIFTLIFCFLSDFLKNCLLYLNCTSRGVLEKSKRSIGEILFLINFIEAGNETGNGQFLKREMKRVKKFGVILVLNKNEERSENMSGFCSYRCFWESKKLMCEKFFSKRAKFLFTYGS